jgi:histone H3/H4
LLTRARRSKMPRGLTKKHSIGAAHADVATGHKVKPVLVPSKAAALADAARIPPGAAAAAAAIRRNFVAAAAADAPTADAQATATVRVHRRARPGKRAARLRRQEEKLSASKTALRRRPFERIVRELLQHEVPLPPRGAAGADAVTDLRLKRGVVDVLMQHCEDKVVAVMRHAKDINAVYGGKSLRALDMQIAAKLVPGAIGDDAAERFEQTYTAIQARRERLAAEKAAKRRRPRHAAAGAASSADGTAAAASDDTVAAEGGSDMDDDDDDANADDGARVAYEQVAAAAH